MKTIVILAIVCAFVFGCMQYGKQYQEFADTYDIYHTRMDDRGLWVFINTVHKDRCAGQTLVRFSKKECAMFLREMGFKSPRNLIGMRVIKGDNDTSNYVRDIISFSDRQLKDVNVRLAMYRSYAPPSKIIEKEVL